MIDLLRKYDLSTEQHYELYLYSKNKNIQYMCTPWDISSVDLLETFPVEAFKVASADLTNNPLIERLIATQKPLIFSTGMSSQEEIENVISVLKSKSVQFALLHCNSTYPAPLIDINLNYMSSMSALHNLVGYSGHERGINVSLAAAALGACIVERHVTLDKEMEGPDHMASLEPNELVNLLTGIREIEEALGSKSPTRIISQGELINRDNLAKSIVASRDLPSGTIIAAEHVEIKSPGQGLSPANIEKLLGRTLRRPMLKEDYFFETDLYDPKEQSKIFDFARPWGLPVRFHDFKDFNEVCSPDLWEFHLSYSDLKASFKTEFPKNLKADFVVHAPELFEGSHLLDLAATDEEYLHQSIKNMEEVIAVTGKLRQIFKPSGRTKIITNCGGFSTNEFLPKREIEKRYAILQSSLSHLANTDVEILPQTMAPFPWHFGGQRYQNLFLQPDDMLDFVRANNLRLCIDVSHTWLMCNYFSLDFFKVMEALGPFCAHLHLADASGLNGEGLQIGDGEIDLTDLSRCLNQHCAGVSFIPEVWQGHKNYGEGFWKALELLSGKI